MNIIIAKLSAKYKGRGTTFLEPYDRLVLYKNDGSISIHNEKGYKPLNYMMAPTIKEELIINGETVWRIIGKDEILEITFHEVFENKVLNLGDNDLGLTREGTEAHLQKWLSENITVLDEKLSFVEREHQTGDGPVDILAKYTNNHYAAIEVKRVAPINTVGQIIRYLDALKERDPETYFEGIIAAVEFKDKTLELAVKKNITCINIPSSWNDGNNDEVGQEDLNLFDFVE